MTRRKSTLVKTGVIRLFGKYSGLYLQVANLWEKQQTEIAGTQGLQVHGDGLRAEAEGFT